MSVNKVIASFIIIEYHSIEDVLQCINSIKNYSLGFSYEIVISSNSLYNTSKQNELKSKHPKIIWSFNEINGGFAYGMNRGIALANGKIIITQNPDTRIINNKLFTAINLFESDPKIGIVGPKILNKLGQIQDTCRPFITPQVIIKRFLKRKLNKSKAILETTINYNRMQSVDWVIGAFMIIRSSTLKKVGGFNEKYFMYFEDMDLCLHFWEEQFKVIYFPDLIIEYEGDRKSTLKKNGKFFNLGINKYTFIHLKSYYSFLKSGGSHKINRIKSLKITDSNQEKFSS